MLGSDRGQEIEQLISERNACRKRGEYSKAANWPTTRIGGAVEVTLW